VFVASTGRDKAKAFPREGANAGLLLASVADGLAHGIDPAGQRRFGDNAAGPDRGNQIIFANDAITIFDEIEREDQKPAARERPERRPRAAPGAGNPTHNY
jgi:hypothetical protein